MANGWILKNHSQTKVDLTNLERLLTLNKNEKKGKHTPIIPIYG